MSKVLEGIRVLDFGRYIAGPFCATLLGDLGADVIRIERVQGSEDRFLSPITPQGDGALFMQTGRNKRGMTLNPMTDGLLPTLAAGRDGVLRVLQEPRNRFLLAAARTLEGPGAMSSPTALLLQLTAPAR